MSAKANQNNETKKLVPKNSELGKIERIEIENLRNDLINNKILLNDALMKVNAKEALQIENFRAQISAYSHVIEELDKILNPKEK